MDAEVRRARPSLMRVVCVWAVLALLAVGSASCTDGGSMASATHTSRGVEPSAGCGRAVAHVPVPAGGDKTQFLDASGVRGSYTLSVPRTYRRHHPTPLILAFYGFGSDPAQFSALTGLPSRGAGTGYMVAVPHTQGAESEWQFTPHGTDATFVDAVVASLEHTYCVDRTSVFAVGFSAGAAFTIVYACARPSQVAAIATVAVEFQLGFTRPLSILAFHGTDDPLVPYDNGAIGLSLPGVKVRGTQRNMGDWAHLDRCSARSSKVRIGSQVIEQQRRGCAPDTSVVLYTIVGGGHTWPGADPKLGVGLTTQQVGATSRVLSFFDRIGR